MQSMNQEVYLSTDVRVFMNWNTNKVSLSSSDTVTANPTTKIARNSECDRINRAKVFHHDGLNYLTGCEVSALCWLSVWYYSGLRSFSNLDRSRSIRAKCSVFFIKPRSLWRIWQKSDSATPICAAGRRCSLFTCKRRRGLRRSTQREQDDHAHYDQKDLHVLFHRTGLISSDKSRFWSRFEKERNQYYYDYCYRSSS